MQEKNNLINETLKTELNIKRKSFAHNFGRKSQDILNAIFEDKYFIEFSHGNKNKKEEVENLFLAVTKTHKMIDQMRYIDSNGREIIRINNDLENDKITIELEKNLQNKEDRAYFEDSIFKIPETIWYTNLDLNMENGKVEIPYKPTIRVIMPLQVESKFNGILIVNFNMSEILENLQRSEYFDNIITNRNGDIIKHYDSNYDWSSYKNNKITLKDFVSEDEYTSIVSKIEFSNKHLRSLSICSQTEESIIIVGKIKAKIIQKMHNELFEK